MNPCCSPLGPSSSPPATLLQVGTLQATVYEGNIFPSAATPATLLAPAGTDFTWSGSADFALGANALLTYSGPGGIFVCVLSVSCDSAGGASRSAHGIALNDDLVGLTPLFSNTITAAGGQRSVNVGGGNSYAVTAQRRVTLAATDTLRPVGGFGIADDLLIEGLTLTIFECAT